MQALASHLGHKSTRLVQNILFTIRNLSDAATKQVLLFVGKGWSSYGFIGSLIRCDLTCITGSP